ncbi:hypothetical protein B0I03_10532 [Flavobacterium aquaticum]|uniref:Uncharacterized protein n=1 Tax=Flavobacterium aquaticum TaxID=1236486 RepID=A0A327YKX9_9FLAO|nr:hypothetical protein [Flavobacterium aquaticum]RAK21600.1 hypothetical protein B0I03_10532 [Flavobacterium aquaticum]
MNVDEVVFLKSGSPKLMITWLVGVTPNNSPIDINKILMDRPNYIVGDISIKYFNKNNEEKLTLPANTLIDNLQNRIPVKNQNLSVGNVVKHKLSDIEMTITWVVGQIQDSNSPIKLNELYNRQGFVNGDIACSYFDKTVHVTKLFRANEVEKIFE